MKIPSSFPVFSLSLSLLLLWWIAKGEKGGRGGDNMCVKFSMYSVVKKYRAALPNFYFVKRI
jgi:hypothetical protein